MLVKYSEDEKQRFAMKYYHGVSAVDIAESANVNVSAVYRWVRKYRDDNKDEQLITQSEISQMERTINRQRNIIEILQAVDCHIKSNLDTKLF